MRRVVLPVLVLLAFVCVVRAEVTIVSDDVASEVDVTPDRQFPCETIPWTDPGSLLPDLVFYRVIGATGPIHVDRNGATIEIWGGGTPASAPPSGGTLEAEAAWSGVRFQSGTAIGRSLTPKLNDDVVLRDADGSATQYFDHDPVTLALRSFEGDCLEADETGSRVVPCDDGARQQWVLDAEGRLRGNACTGEWQCLVTPGLADGAAPTLQPCRGPEPLPEETWAIERWNEPIDTAALLTGVHEVELPYTYWSVSALEGTAVPLLLAPDGRPIVVVGTAGSGRAAAFGTWLPVCADGADATFSKLMQNLVNWAGGSASPVVGLSPDASGQQGCFAQLGFTTVQTTPDNLSGIDVYVMRGGDDGAPDTDAALIEDFLRNGGGLLASHHAFFYWDIAQYPPTDNLIARVFSRAGLAWSEDIQEAAVEGTTLFLTGDPPEEETYQVAAALEGFVRDQLGIENLTTDELTAIDDNMPVAVTARALLTDVSPLTVAQRALKRIHGPLLIGPTQPFNWGDSMVADMALRGDYVLAEALPPDRTTAHESAALYPGLTDPDAPRLNRIVTIDGDVPSTSHEMWRSTGLYAPPGEDVTVRFPPAAIGERVYLQIGASFDNVMPHAGWLAPGTIGRFPWITAGRLVQSEEIRLASSFGGPIYVTVPSGTALGPIDVEIDGAVEMSTVTLGGGANAAWQGDLEDTPLVELTGDNVIVTTRSSVVASVADPVATLQQLDAIIDAEADLVGIVDDHAGGETIPQRLVFDPFEDWGAHSGYPIHMTQSWDAELLDMTVWPDESGLWAFLHEFGHNHQQGMWTLGHHGEVTCNILAVYAFETVLSLPMSEAWGGNLEAATMQQRTQSWLDSGQPYNTQGYDVGLYFFLYVKEAFGWGPFHTMYSEYRALPENQRPQTEQEKIDQLAVRMSNATGHNLVPWFETFRFPLSAWVYDEVVGLPLWDTAPF